MLGAFKQSTDVLESQVSNEESALVKIQHFVHQEKYRYCAGLHT